MFPTVHLGPFVFPTYTFLIDFGVVGTLAWLWFRAPAYGRTPNRWLDAGLAGTVGAFLGGRIAFAIANWGYFQSHFFEMFKLWEGGYAWIGAAVGGLLGLAIYGRVKQEPLLPMLDELAMPVTLISALGWFGCVAAACAAGKDVPPGSVPFAVNWPDLYGVILPRWPTQLIGLGLSLLVFAFLLMQRNAKWPAGVGCALTLTLVAVIMFGVSFVRGDDMPLLASWRLDTVTNALAIGLGLIATVAAWALEPAKAKEKALALAPAQEPQPNPQAATSDTPPPSGEADPETL